jgi:hypothetical protein
MCFTEVCRLGDLSVCEAHQPGERRDALPVPLREAHPPELEPAWEGAGGTHCEWRADSYVVDRGQGSSVVPSYPGCWPGFHAP